MTVPPGPVLSDALKYSPILVGEDGVAPVGNFDFDVDPSIDPELALVRTLLWKMDHLYD